MQDSSAGKGLNLTGKNLINSVPSIEVPEDIEEDQDEDSLTESDITPDKVPIGNL